MLRKFTLAACSLMSLPLLNHAQSNEVIPNSSTNTSTGSTFGIFATAARSYQWLIDSTLLTTLMNNTITGVSFRGLTAASSAWPAAAVTINNFDLYMGKSILVQDATFVFATNQSGAQTQVRSGSLQIPAGSFPSGNSWGPIINFNTPYVYTGGNLSVLLRNDGYTGTGKSVDALGTTTANYNVLYKANYEAGYTSAGNTAANFVILRFTYSTTPLPVELLSFECTVSGYNADIKWESASEKNTKQYIIERSIDGIHFEALQTVAANGQNDGVMKYAFTDLNVFKGNETAFYRLKMVENDGTFKYSTVNKIRNGKVQEGNLIVYPNPVKSICNVIYSLMAEGEVTCQVYDITGRMVHHETFKASKGNNGMLMDFGSFQNGQYVLKLTGNGIEDSYRFIKE